MCVCMCMCVGRGTVSRVDFLCKCTLVLPLLSFNLVFVSCKVIAGEKCYLSGCLAASSHPVGGLPEVALLVG